MRVRPVIALIRFLRADEGGRDTLPKGPRYTAICRIKDEVAPAWALSCEFTEPLSNMKPSYAVVQYLIPGAPQAKLVPGATFELLEGLRLVAEGSVTEFVRERDARE